MHTLIRIERDSKMNLKGRNFLTLKDFTPEEIIISDRSGSRSEREEEKGNSGGSLPWKECSPDL